MDGTADIYSMSDKTEKINRNTRKEGRATVEGYKIAITIAMWVFGGICVLVMKKIEPDNKIYPVWALFIALAFTIFAVYDWLG